MFWIEVKKWTENVTRVDHAWYVTREFFNMILHESRKINILSRLGYLYVEVDSIKETFPEFSSAIFVQIWRFCLFYADCDVTFRQMKAEREIYVKDESRTC